MESSGGGGPQAADLRGAAAWIGCCAEVTFFFPTLPRTHAVVCAWTARDRGEAWIHFPHPAMSVPFSPFASGRERWEQVSNLGGWVDEWGTTIEAVALHRKREREREGVDHSTAHTMGDQADRKGARQGRTVWL